MGSASDRLATLIARCEGNLGEVARARTSGDKLAIEVEGELALRWRLAVLRSALDAPPAGEVDRDHLVTRECGAELHRLRAAIRELDRDLVDRGLAHRRLELELREAARTRRDGDRSATLHAGPGRERDPARPEHRAV